MRKARANDLRTRPNRVGLAAAIGATLAWGACAQIVGADFDREFGAGPGGGAGAQGGNGGSSGPGGAGGNGGRGGSGGAGGAGGGATNETDCTDCLDDDGDGKIDRDDDDCAPDGAFTCVETDEASTLAPFALLVSPANEEPPPCESGSEVLAPAYENLDAEPAKCGGCNCDKSAVKCGAKGESFSGSQCATATGTTKTETDGSCTTATNKKFSRTTPPCKAAGPTKTVPPPTWSRSVRGCSLAAPEGGACGEGRVCLEPTSNVCIALDGDVSCPPAYPEPLVIARPDTDSRGCSKCICTRSPCTTGYTITTFSQFGCGGASATSKESDFFGACATAPSVEIQMPNAPACTLSQNTTPIGKLPQKDLQTICCKQPPTS